MATLVFILSGFSALTFEVLWVRLASHSLGVTTWAVSVVVSTFMGGLALGGLIFGPPADRSKRPSWMYAKLEFLIALTALGASLVLQKLPQWGLGFTAQVALIAATLLIPCTLMGGTLPALGRAVAQLGASKACLLYTSDAADE